MPPVRASPAKRWVFTLNNWTDEEEAEVRRFIERECSYGVFGREVGESGTKHLQGFVIVKRKVRLPQLTGYFNNRAHLEVARGTPEDSRVYCTKDGDFYEWGTCPAGDGKAKSRDTLGLEFKSCVEGEEGIAGFADANPGAWFFSGSTMLRNMLALQRPRERPGGNVRWLYGAPGVGKSRFAHAELPRAYIKDPATKWWTGYFLEVDCIIDDIGPKGVSITNLLRWFDRYKCTVEGKGTEMPLYVENWIVTSNYHPRDVYRSETGEEHPQIEALLRRITVIHYRDGIQEICNRPASVPAAPVLVE